MKDGLGTGITTAATTSLGITQILGMIPDNIGKLACVVGIIATFTIIVVNVYNLKKIRLENEILRKKIEDD